MDKWELDLMAVARLEEAVKHAQAAFQLIRPYAGASLTGSVQDVRVATNALIEAARTIDVAASDLFDEAGLFIEKE